MFRLFGLTAGFLAATALAAPPPEPAVQRSVHEDDGVRIVELRVRGLNRSLLVQPKAASAPAYEIVPADPDRDATPGRTRSGTRLWRLLSF